MKILVLAGSYPSDQHPAAGAFVREQARAIAARHEVVVACQGRADAEEERDGLRVLRLGRRASRIPSVRAHRERQALRRALERLARDGFRPDIVHAHFYYVGVWAVQAGRGVPVVLSEHSSGFPRGLVTGGRARTASVALHGAAVVCPVSEYLRDSIRAAGFDVPMRVVPNPIDAAAFRPAGPRSPGSPPTVVTVAALNPLKGIDALIEAVAAAGARLVVVGDGEQRAGLEAQAAERHARVEFRGELAKPDVARTLADSDLFCLPSLGETHGVAFIEAAASGLPVLGTRVGGVPEIVGPGDGELVAAGDQEALTAALTRMLGALDTYDREAIRARAVERFGYPRIADLWDEVYAGVS